LTVDVPEQLSPTRPARLKRRAEFLRVAASGRSRQCRAFKLQMAERADETEAARFGFTVTKKTANAVGRNRIRRRLREALRLSAALAASKRCDYVFVARRAALDVPFPELQNLMRDALSRLSPASGARPRQPSGTGR
jgi:ribonuclease P protein component